MKKQLLTLTALLGLSLMLFSCSDDKSTSPNPEPKDDVTYFDNNVYSYTYDEYDLDTTNSPIDATRHQDSLEMSQVLTKDGKKATEYKVFTNVDGSYTPVENEYYAGETNKLYAHLSVFQSMFANIESDGFTLEALFNGAGNWFLVADAKATGAWTIYEGKQTFTLPEPFPVTDADVKITMKKNGTQSITIEGKTVTVDVNTYTANIQATLYEQAVDINVTGEFWVSPNIGVVKSNVKSFKLPIIGTPIEGTERVLVKYTVQTAI